jgi:hypothetical protein
MPKPRNRPHDARNTLSEQSAADYVGVSTDELARLVKSRAIAAPVMHNGKPRYHVAELSEFKRSGRAVRWLARA